MTYRNPQIRLGRYTLGTVEICSMILVLVPVLNIYMTPVPVLTLGEIVLFIIAGYLLICSRQNELIEKNTVIFLSIYSTVVTVFSAIINSRIANEFSYKEILAFIIYVVLLFIIGQRINLESLLFYYKKVAFVFAIFLIVQYVVHLMTGEWIPGVVPGVESSYGRSTTEIIERMERASSVFKEPAHYAQYMAIPYVSILFKNKKSLIDKIYLAVYAVSLALTFSGNALIVVFIPIGIYILYIGKKKGLLHSLLAGGVISIILIYLMFTNPKFNSLLARVQEIGGTNPARYSGYIRILRGYLVYNEFPIIAKLFGVGLGMYLDFAMHYAYDILTQKTLLELEYINGIQYYLVSTGLIGVVLYLKCIIKSFTKSEESSRYVAVVFFVLILVSGMNRGPGWLLFMIVMLAKPKCKAHEVYT